MIGINIGQHTHFCSSQLAETNNVSTFSNDHVIIVIVVCDYIRLKSNELADLF